MAPGFGYGTAEDSGGDGDDLEYYAVGLVGLEGLVFFLGGGGGGGRGVWREKREGERGGGGQGRGEVTIGQFEGIYGKP